MVREVKWTKYLWLSLLLFGAFMLEYFSIFVIEFMILHVDIWNYTVNQRSVHCMIMVLIWAVVIVMALFFSQRYYHFPSRENKEDHPSLKNWVITFSCLICCKILTFIDWHTLKVFGEVQGKNAYQFCAQYLCYIIRSDACYSDHPIWTKSD